MSCLRLEYETLLSGVYPFEGTFEKNIFKIVRNIVDGNRFNDLCNANTLLTSKIRRLLGQIQ